MPAKENGENGNKAQSKWKGEKWAYQYGPQSMPISGTGVVIIGGRTCPLGNLNLLGLILH